MALFPELYRNIFIDNQWPLQDENLAFFGSHPFQFVFSPKVFWFLPFFSVPYSKGCSNSQYYICGLLISLGCRSNLLFQIINQLIHLILFSRFDQEREDSSVPVVIASLREILLMMIMRIITTQHTVIMSWNQMSHKPYSCTIFLLVILGSLWSSLGKSVPIFW